jgi:NAD(P)H-dependent FMN reductase
MIRPRTFKETDSFIEAHMEEKKELLAMQEKALLDKSLEADFNEKAQDFLEKAKAADAAGAAVCFVVDGKKETEWTLSLKK